MLDFTCVCIIALAFTGELIFGFGGGLVAVPLLSALVPVNIALALGLTVQLASAVAQGFKLAEASPFRQVRYPLLGSAFGTLAGLWILRNIEIQLFKLLLVGFIIFYLLNLHINCSRSLYLLQRGLGIRPLNFLRRRKFHFGEKTKSAQGIFAGVISGCAQGCLGMGGPPLVIYFREVMPEREQARAAITTVLLIENLIRTPILLGEILSTDLYLRLLLWSAPLSVPIWYGANWIKNGMGDHTYSKVVNGLLVGAATTLIIQLFLSK